MLLADSVLFVCYILAFLFFFSTRVLVIAIFFGAQSLPVSLVPEEVPEAMSVLD